MQRLLVFTVMLLVGVQLRGQWDIDESKRKSLTGVSGVGVVVESLPQVAEVIGLSKDMIQTDVELRLRLAGMNIVPPPLPWALDINVTLTASGHGADVRVCFFQPVWLDRNRSIKAYVPTWWDGGILVNPTVNGIRQMVKDVVDAFLNDWLTVNPKPK